MAVEIKELVIRAVVDTPSEGVGSNGMSPREREQLVRDCVEEMQKILKREKLR